MYKKIMFFLIIGLFVVSIVFAFDSEEKAELDRRQQQIVAQVQSKIELESKKTKDEVNNLISQEAQDIQNNLIKDMQKRFKDLLIGLFGFIFLVMAIFEIVKIKLSTDILYRKKIKDVEKLKEHLTKEEKKLKDYRDKLDKHNKELNDYKKKLQKKVPKLQKILLVSNIITLLGLFVMIILFVRGG
jgi:predicted PurR-regulated permease PerM